MAGIFEGRFKTPQRGYQGVLQGRFGEPEVKIEEQFGEPTKTTTTLKPSTEDIMTEPKPMEVATLAQSWQAISDIIDMTWDESASTPPSDPLFDTQMQGVPPNAAPEQSNPFDPSGVQGPQGDVSGAAFNNPHLGGAQHVPPAGEGFHPMEGPPPYVPQGAPPGQPPADPTAGVDQSFTGYPNQMGVEQPFEGYPNQQGIEAPPQAVDAGTGINEDWLELQMKVGFDTDNVEKSEATIATAASEATGNTVNGVDATNDPVMSSMWDTDPRIRQNEYLKQMNMITLGGIMLDLAASAMGVKSRSGTYMEAQFKHLEQQMKFDDQNRIYEASKRVYYGDGTYKNPGSQSDVFDALMKTGMVSVAEAAAISGHHPEGDQGGFDTYYQAQPDGTVKTIYVPKGQTPPIGATSASGVATHNAGVLDPTSGGSTPADIKTEKQINDWMVEAANLEAAGDIEGANALRLRAKNLLALGGGASTKNEYGYTAARATYKDIYGSMATKSAEFMNKDNTFRDEKGDYIPWSKFREMWMNSYSVPVMGSDGTMTEEHGWLAIKGDPTETAAQINPSLKVATPATIQMVKDNPSPELIKEFIRQFGIEQLPQEFR